MATHSKITLPNMSRLVLNCVKTDAGMMDTDDEDDEIAPAAPVAAAPPRMLTERQKGAVLEYLRSEIYEQFFWYLNEEWPDTPEEEEVGTSEYEKWEIADSSRTVDYENSDAHTILAGTADERVTKAVRIVANNARDAVQLCEADLYAQVQMPEIATRLDGVAQFAVQQVEDFMRKQSIGFFSQAAEDFVVQQMADTLEAMLDPN